MDIRYDQHYLNDKDILTRIVESSDITNEDKILEIGSGKGSLTEFIIKKSPEKLICIEIDNSHKLVLDNFSNKYDFFEYIIGDVIKEIDNVEFDKIVANIPYGITENLYRKIVDKKVSKVVLTHGKKFYDLLVSNNSMWHHILNSFYDIKLIDVVEGDSFEPPTKVKSVIVELNLKRDDLLTQKDLFIQNLFAKKERNLKNCIIFSIVDTYSVSKKDAENIFNDINLDSITLSKKLNNISNDSFMKILEGLGFY